MIPKEESKVTKMDFRFRDIIMSKLSRVMRCWLMGHGDKETVVFSKVKDAFLNSVEQGGLPDNLVEISKILETALPNNKSSDFPDFIFEKGFIEHFQVTSSKETRKGAEHIKDKNIHDGKLAGIERRSCMVR
ncbi:hypothetical protein LAX80_005075 [Listeria marthii]|nr:hypothetical protein LAX80_005075 [Listeria marthii]